MNFLRSSIRKIGLALAAVIGLAIITPAQSADAQSALWLAKLESPDHRVQAVAFSPDGKLLAAGYGF